MKLVKPAPSLCYIPEIVFNQFVKVAKIFLCLGTVKIAHRFMMNQQVRAIKEYRENTIPKKSKIESQNPQIPRNNPS